MNPETTSRYDRQMRIDEIGAEGQARLLRSSVLIVGVGGLGCPVAQYLCGAGVGRIGLVDDDAVSLSNLHRQVLYDEDNVGKPKAECAARRLRRLNSGITVEAYNRRLDESNARDLISRYDIVVDGCDNYATRRLVDRVCGLLGKPYVYGSICGFTGQVSVFHYGMRPLAYTDLYATAPALPADPSVTGPAPGVTGSVQAAQAIQILSGGTPSLAGRLWFIDLLTMENHLIELAH